MISTGVQPAVEHHVADGVDALARLHGPQEPVHVLGQPEQFVEQAVPVEHDPSGHQRRQRDLAPDAVPPGQGDPGGWLVDPARELVEAVEERGDRKSVV